MQCSKGSKDPEFLSQFETEKVSVLPTKTIGIADIFTDTIKESVLTNCQQLGCDWVSVRMTHASDFKGMVDVMPTREGPKEKIGELVSLIQQLIEEEMHRMNEYSESEASGFASEQAQITIAPLIEGSVNIVTEHPNREGLLLNDILECREMLRADGEKYIWRNPKETLIKKQK